MKICGSCGVELTCIKTGLKIHDTRYHPLSRHSADLFACKECSMLFINRAEGEFFASAQHNPLPDAIIEDGLTIRYSPEFKLKLKDYLK